MVHGLKVSVHLSIDAISCPGSTIAESRGDFHIEVRLFNTHYRSNDFYPYFPVIVRSQFPATKLIPSITDPSSLAAYLETESASVELYQGNKLVSFSHTTARKFLFPGIPVKTYCDSQRELLLDKTPVFDAVLQPKLEFGTTVTIEETEIRPRLGGYLEKCAVLVTIDDRIRGRTRKQTPKNPEALIEVEHSKTYNDLHEKIRAALESNKPNKFVMKPQALKEKRAPAVFLSETSDWSEYASTYRGECFRETFDCALDEIYCDMLEHHEQNLLKKPPPNP